MADVTWYGTDTTNPTNVGTGANWSTSSVPTTGDHVRLVAGYTGSISESLSSLASVALGDFVVEHGFTGSIGKLGTPLDIQASRFEFHGGGTSYINLQSSSIDAIVHGTNQNAAIGRRGLYLTGTTLQTVSVTGGDVGIASQHGDTSSVSTLRVHSGLVYVGNGCTLTTVDVYGGRVELQANVTNLNVYGGTVVLAENADATTITVEGGAVDNIGSGAITTATIKGGVLSMRGGIARTITTLNYYAGGNLEFDDDVVTITTPNFFGPIRLSSVQM